MKLISRDSLRVLLELPIPLFLYKKKKIRKRAEEEDHLTKVVRFTSLRLEQNELDGREKINRKNLDKGRDTREKVRRQRSQEAFERRHINLASI